MSEKKIDFIEKLGRYGIWLAICGIVSYIFTFPSGIYYCFFCGVLSAACGILAKMNKQPKGSTISIIAGMFDIGLSAMAFYGMLLLFTAASDPEHGAEITRLMTDMLNTYGVSMDTFSSLISGL